MKTINIVCKQLVTQTIQNLHISAISESIFRLIYLDTKFSEENAKMITFWKSKKFYSTQKSALLASAKFLHMQKLNDIFLT